MSSVTKSNNLVNKRFAKLGLLTAGVILCGVGFKLYIQPWVKRRRAAKAEEFANVIYEQRKKRVLEND